MKISSFLISIVLVGLFVTVFASFYSGVGEEYGVTFDSNTSADLAAYNEFENIRSTTEAINTTLFASPSGESGITDFVGKFLGAGFNVLKLARQSFSSFFNLGNAAASALGLPAVFESSLMTIALILLIFIIIAVLVGRDV